MDKILVVTSPSLSIRKKVPFPHTSYGTAELCGGLKNAGYDVHYYDLNVALNRIRGNYELTKEDDHLLKTLPSTFTFDIGVVDDDEHIFIKWINSLLEIIEVEDFKVVGISLDDTYVWDPDEIYRSDIFNFSILLSYKLKQKFPDSKIYVGGKMLLDVVPKENFTRSMKCKDLQLDAIFMEEAKAMFPKFISNNTTYSNYEINAIYNRRGTRIILDEIKIPPYWDIKNREDALWNINSIVPQDVKQEFRELKFVEPFSIASYKFTYGCKFNCSFCTTALSSSFQVDVKTVVDSIEKIYEQGYKSFRFYNSSINADLKYIIEICNELVKRNIKIFFSDSANLSFMTEEVTSALKEAGCIKLWFGGESGSDRILKLNNKHLTVKKIHEKLELSHKAGIWNAVNFIVAFPNETEEEFNQTKELAHSKYVDCFRANVFNLYPLSEYARNPSKFDTTLIKLVWIAKNNRKSYSYNDLYSTWEEKKLQGAERLSKMRGDLFNQNSIGGSDELLFGISQVIKEKSQKTKFFSSLVESFDTNLDLINFKRLMVH